VVQYFLDKTINAETRIKVLEQFDAIVINSMSENDSLKCSVTAPYNSDYFEYYSDLNLDVPYKVPCTINSPNNGVLTTYLDTTLYVQNSFGKIEVEKHEGSCDLKTSAGDILIEMILPENGYCRSYSASGKIKLKIPKLSSASVYAKTLNGTVTFTNLDILNIEEADGLLSGKLAEGNGTIHLETKNGDIEIAGFDL